MSWRHVLSLSGGKDSTALLLLAIERGTPNLEAVFADTGHEHPITYEYVGKLAQITDVPVRWVRADFSEEIADKRRYIVEQWPRKGVPAAKVERALAALHPTGIPFLDLCLWKTRFPSRMAQFCTAELKKLPIAEQVINPLLHAGHKVVSWQGVRRAESLARRRVARVERMPEGRLWAYRPLVDWSVEDVFAIHRRHGVDPNPLYRLGMRRVGCMPCINCRKDELWEIGRRFPEEAIDKVREWERLLGEVSKCDASTFFHDDTPDGLPIDEAVAWARTSRGGRQFDMLKSDLMPAPSCASAYGLCDEAA